MIEDDRYDLQAARRKPFDSVILPLASCLALEVGFSAVRDMPIGAFFYEMMRAQKLKNYENLMHSIYSRYIDNSKISGNEVILPAGFDATRVGVYYEFETTDAVKLSDNSESFGQAAKYLFQIYIRDICTDQKRLGILLFPEGKLDNNVTLALTTEGKHPLHRYRAEGLLLRRIQPVLLDLGYQLISDGQQNLKTL